MRIDRKRPNPLQSKSSKSKSKAQKPSASGLFERVFGAAKADQDSIDPIEKTREMELAELLRELDDLGKELALRKSKRALDDYTSKVKEVLKDFQENAYTEISLIGGEISGRAKEMHISRKVNEELVELTKIVMGQEKQNIDLAASIANIKGLLIDLRK